MFEFICKNGTKVTMNPKMITAVQEESSEYCKVYLSDDGNPFILKASYEEVRDFWYKCLA